MMVSMDLFNCIVFDHQNPNLKPYNERKGDKYKSIVFGPTCDSVDKICENLELPEMEIADWCYIENFGAYTVASSTDFNGFTKLKVYYVLN